MINLLYVHFGGMVLWWLFTAMYVRLVSHDDSDLQVGFMLGLVWPAVIVLFPFVLLVWLLYWLLMKLAGV